MAQRETDEQALSRWDELHALQEHYADFLDFLYDVITELMGFTCTWVQLDIANFLQHGPLYSMIQAQRGQAKTTITACYAVWRLIHDPSTRILIISGGGDMAIEISNWIIQIINNMDELECMRPDQQAGDRASVKAFDVHYSLKGAEKSPSVACKGIFSQLQGKRADLLIADDIETKENSESEPARIKLRERTKDFTSICSTGKIVYLGTPQSVDSIYNSLPERGYSVRIWSGRYPTEKEEENYNGCLAQSLIRRMAVDPSLRTGGGPTGDRGQAVDPDLLPEDVLTTKEIDQGAAYFQLQHMLDTRLMDADRYPLNPSRLVVTNVHPVRMPITLDFAPTVDCRVVLPNGHPLYKERLYTAAGSSNEFADFSGTYMYIDPSGGGQNGDELAWAVTRFLAGYIYLVGVGGFPGGLHQANLDRLTLLAEKYKPHTIGIERNFGNGALAQVWTPQLLKKHKCSIDEPWESGQKELRIIDIMEPLIGSSRFVVDEDVIKEDWESCQRYPAEIRSSYSFLYQLAKITRERGALLHDDRLDAVAGACRPWADQLAIDAEKEVAKAKRDAYHKMMKDPLGNGRPVPGYKKFGQHKSLGAKFGFAFK